MYRKPNDKLDLFKNNLSDLLQKVDAQKKKCLLMGDFNIDLLKIEENQYTNYIVNHLHFSINFKTYKNNK